MSTFFCNKNGDKDGVKYSGFHQYTFKPGVAFLENGLNMFHIIAREKNLIL